MSDDDAEAVRELDEMRAGASERGLALIMLRHDTPGGVQLEPLYVGTEPQEDGMVALRILDRDDLRFEFLAHEDDLRRVLDEPVDLSQPDDVP